MGELAKHLQSELPNQIPKSVSEEWKHINSLIGAKGLEPALMECEPSEELDVKIGRAVVGLLSPQEEAVIGEVLSGARVLRFSKLVPYLPIQNSGIPILTTNYDRLVEFACEAVGLPVDPMFDGAVLGRPDAKESRENQMRTVGLHGGKVVRKRYRRHARVFKPHGSLDWYDTKVGPRRFAGTLPAPRMIVTPGRRKLRKGYDSPFDQHRETMNRLLDEAARLLVVGYGFNDDHLETRLSARIKSGIPTLILTHSLSQRAKEFAQECEAVIAIDSGSVTSSRVFFERNTFELPIEGLWDLGRFVEEVLSP